jgi:Arc/MetJ-type ribon-helix-helix transcriptional regulator
VDLQTHQIGHYVTRTDVIREAIHGLLQRALPPPQTP